MTIYIRPCHHKKNSLQNVLKCFFAVSSYIFTELFALHMANWGVKRLTNGESSHILNNNHGNVPHAHHPTINTRHEANKEQTCENNDSSVSNCVEVAHHFKINRFNILFS